MAKHLAANETLKMLISSYNGTDCIIPGLEAAVHRATTARKKSALTSSAGMEGHDDYVAVGPNPDVVEDLGDGRATFNYGPIPQWSEWTCMLNTYCQIADLKMPTFTYNELEVKTLAGKAKCEYECLGEWVVDKPICTDILDKIGENTIIINQDIHPTEEGDTRTVNCKAIGTSKKDGQHRVAALMVARILPHVTCLSDAVETMNEMKKNKRASVRAKKRERQSASISFDGPGLLDASEGELSKRQKKLLAKARTQQRRLLGSENGESQMRDRSYTQTAHAQENDVDVAMDNVLLEMNETKQSQLKEAALRRATINDVGVLLEMIQQYAESEGQSTAVSLTEETLIRDGFGANKVFYAILAEKDGDAVGFCLFYISYATWEGRCLFLEDIYLSKDASNLGKLFFIALSKIAKSLDCGRILWMALDDHNEGAQRFYSSIGGTKFAEWQLYRMSREGIASLSET